VPAIEFFEGTWTTCLGDDELLVASHFPVWEGRCGFAFDEVARRSGDFALAGVAAAVELGQNDVVQRCSLGMLGVSSTAVRAPEAEASITGRAPTAADLEEVGRLAAADVDPPEDIHATASYRRRVIAHLVRRALVRALAEARERA
jgi:carbon-monoxide dehydrogenase medium subunit